MATTKKRMNLSLPTQINTAIYKLAERDQMPPATKAASLLQLALEVEEDDWFNQLTEERDTTTAKFVPHEAVW